MKTALGTVESLQREESMNESRSRPTYGLFWPVAIIALTTILAMSFQTYLVLQEASVIKVAKANQEAMVQQAKKVQDQVDSVARGTALLAAEGNKGAQEIVAALKARGVTINPNAPSTPPAQ